MTYTNFPDHHYSDAEVYAMAEGRMEAYAAECGDVEVLGVFYSQARIMRELDPVAWDNEVANTVDSVVDDLVDDGFVAVPGGYSRNDDDDDDDAEEDCV